MVSPHGVVSVSCPGKALVCGGYLIVERPNPGISLALSVRVHCTAEVEASEAPGNEGRLLVVVHSPQFERSWEYSFPEQEGAVSHPGEAKNPFVEAAVQLAVKGLRRKLLGKLVLTLYADNPFYCISSDAPRFSKPPTGGRKSGLGSSAGVVTSVVGAVLAAAEEEEQFREKVHHIAQAAHSRAQGKVGSGFDVATAVYGSLRYVRFSPEALDQDRLDYFAAPFSLPVGFCLALGDVKQGSDTRSMVSGVTAWRKENGDVAQVMWQRCVEANQKVCAALDALHGVDVSGECAAFERDGVAGELLRPLQAAFAEARSALRAVGEAAGVPIEPPSQTRLLDATLSSVPGIIAAGCPGAGGFDAVFCICVSSAVRSRLGDYWRSYAPAGSVTLLPVDVDNSSGISIKHYASVEEKDKDFKQ